MENKEVKKYYLQCDHCKQRKKRVAYRKGFDEMLLCDNCHKLLTKHPINDIPSKGEVSYDEEGRLICHICGRAYDKLTTHIKQAHKIEPGKYKEMFELNRTFSLTSEKFKQKCRESIKKNDGTTRLTHFEKGKINYVDENGKVGAIKKRRLQYVKSRLNEKYNKDK